MTNEPQSSALRHFTWNGDFIVTADADGSLTVNAQIVARVDTREGADAIVNQANVASDLYAALVSMLEDYRAYGCRSPECLTCTKSREAEYAALTAMAKARGVPLTSSHDALATASSDVGTQND